MMSDRIVGDVCDLDMVFSFLKVCLISDEFIFDDELQETSKKAFIELMGELEKQEYRVQASYNTPFSTTEKYTRFRP